MVDRRGGHDNLSRVGARRNRDGARFQLAQNTVDVNPPWGDAQIPHRPFLVLELINLEAVVWERDSAGTDDVDGLGLRAMVLNLQLLIGVGVHLHAPLLYQHATIVFLPIESSSTEITRHKSPPVRANYKASMTPASKPKRRYSFNRIRRFACRWG